MTLRDAYLQEINYLELGFIIVCSSILKSLWMIYIDNLLYRVVGLNRESAYHTFIVAIMATIIFLIFVSVFNHANAGFSANPSGPINPTNPPGPSNSEIPKNIIADEEVDEDWHLEPLNLDHLKRLVRPT